MKKIIFSSLFLVMLTSLCVNLPDIPFVQQDDTVPSGISAILSSQDISLEAMYSSSDIKVGRTLNFYMTLTNKQDYDISNINVEVYDNPCFDGTFDKTFSTLRADTSTSWTAKFTPKSSIVMDTTCPIRFRVGYEGKYFKTEDIAVLAESEYMLMETEGRLSSIPLRSTSTSSPLAVNIKYSENQPFLEDQKYYMYFEYSNRGSGNFENLDITFTPPSNAAFSCSGVSNNQIQDVQFVRGVAPMTTCSVTTSGVSTINIDMLRVSATYNYILDDSFIVNVGI